MTRFMAQIPGTPTQVGSALQTQSLTIAETLHSHQIKLPAWSICSHRLGKNVRKRALPCIKPTRGGHPRFSTFRCIATFVSSRQWAPSTGQNKNEPGPPVPKLPHDCREVNQSPDRRNAAQTKR